MASLTEGARYGDIVRWELERNISRKTVTLAAASTTTVKKGAVLGIVTASGKYIPSVYGASDGSQSAVAINIEDVATNTTGVSAVVLRRFALILQADLVWDSSYSDDAKKLTALTNLESASTIIAVPSTNYI